MNNYLSFKNFSTNEYHSFIESCPKKLLLAPLKGLSKYKVSPLIKGFRDDSIKIETIRNFYYKEEKKHDKTLSNEILRLIDKKYIKSILTLEQYSIVSKQISADKDVYDKIIKEFCESEENVLKIEYIIKLFDLDIGLANEISRLDFEKKEKKLEYKYTKEINRLKEKKEQLLAEIDKQKSEIQILKDILKIKEEKIKELKGSLNQIEKKNEDENNNDISKKIFIDMLDKIQRKIIDYSHSEIFDEFKRINIKNYSVEDVYNKINKLKKEAIKEENTHLYNKMTFVELMVLNILEEINNGK